MPRGLTRTINRADPLSNAAGFKRIRQVLNNVSITVTTITTSAGFGSISIGLPEGFLAVACASAWVSYSTTSANVTNTTFGSNLAIGTAADAAGTTSLAGTLGNVAASAAAPAAVAKVVTGAKVTSAGLVAGILVDNHAKNANLFLNLNVAAADMSDGTTATFVVNGYIDLIGVLVGDN